MQRFSQTKHLFCGVFWVALSFGLILVTNGCFESSPKAPSWYGKTQTQGDMLIGFGSAQNLESAKANALSDIVSQLSVRVDSRFSSGTQRNDSTLSYYSNQNIQLNSIGIKLNDVQYVQSTFEDGKFYIQAQIPKRSLITQFQNEIALLHNSLESLSTARCPTLSIKEQVRLTRALESLQMYNALLQTLGAQPISLQNLEMLLARNTPLPSAKLIVRSNIPSEIFKNALAKELGHFYTLDSQASQTINVKANIQPGIMSAKVDILLSITDCQNNPIFHTNVSYTHRASSTNEALKFASQRSSVQLYKHIQEWIEK